MTNEEIVKLTGEVTFGNATLDRLCTLLEGVKQWPSWEFCDLVTEIWVNLPAEEDHYLCDRLAEIQERQTSDSSEASGLSELPSLYRRVDPSTFRHVVAEAMERFNH